MFINLRISHEDAGEPKPCRIVGGRLDKRSIVGVMVQLHSVTDNF